MRNSKLSHVISLTLLVWYNGIVLGEVISVKELFWYLLKNYYFSIDKTIPFTHGKLYYVALLKYVISDELVYYTITWANDPNITNYLAPRVYNRKGSFQFATTLYGNNIPEIPVEEEKILYPLLGKDDKIQEIVEKLWATDSKGFLTFVSLSSQLTYNVDIVKTIGKRGLELNGYKFGLDELWEIYNLEFSGLSILTYIFGKYLIEHRIVNLDLKKFYEKIDEYIENLVYVKNPKLIYSKVDNDEMFEKRFNNVKKRIKEFIEFLAKRYISKSKEPFLRDGPHLNREYKDIIRELENLKDKDPVSYVLYNAVYLDYYAKKLGFYNIPTVELSDIYILPTESIYALDGDFYTCYCLNKNEKLEIKLIENRSINRLYFLIGIPWETKKKLFPPKIPIKVTGITSNNRFLVKTFREYDTTYFYEVSFEQQVEKVIFEVEDGSICISEIRF